ncbi:MAG: long-chain fatty acid--CoA ligase [Saprospiraceae bacterium]|nr:long-chain fatty acid--CoA ligase [Saprospiraceae bacterium]
MNVPDTDWIGKWAIYSPNKIALKEVDNGRTLTYHQLNQLASKVANYLTTQHSLKKGDRIAIIAENCLEYFILFSTAQKTGLILVPLNYRLTSPELADLFAKTEPVLTIVEDQFREKLNAVPAHLRGSMQLTLAELIEISSAQQAEKVIDFHAIHISSDDPIFILFTSGTTGYPKGTIYSHKMLFWNSMNTSLSLIINSDSRSIHCLPPFHTGGWNVLSTPLLHHGGCICVTKKFEPKQILQILAEEKITVFMGVPTMLKMMAEQPDFSTCDLSNLYYIIVGGEPMPIPLIEKWHTRKIPIRQGYGMTEVGPNLTSLHQRDAKTKKGSIGRPNFYVRVRIIDDKGREVKCGETGELVIKGPMVTPGYWKDEAATQEAFHQDWFKTGDLVRMDEEGYLYVVDRIKNMYISGGENVYPAEVERILDAHSDISEAAVVAVPDKKWGETGKAFVVRSSGSELTIDQIIAHCKHRLAAFKIPKYITFVDSIPKNESGKVDRKTLKGK